MYKTKTPPQYFIQQMTIYLSPPQKKKLKKQKNGETLN